MEEKKSFQVSNIQFSTIKAIAKDGAVKGAIGSLLAWGGINLGAWFLLGTETRNLLSSLPNPSDELTILIYGGAVIGAAMLLFAAIGALTRAAFTIFLDGLSLIGVGGWNLAHDFLANDALRPYGYKIESPGTMWIILGVCQLVWGFRQFGHFKKIASWSGAICDPIEFGQTKQFLSSLSKEAEDLPKGRIKASTTIKGPLGLGVFDKTIQYFGWLSSDRLYLVSVGMDDCISIEKEAATNAVYGAKGAMSVRTDRGNFSLSLGALSVMAIKGWCSQIITFRDLQFLAEQKKAAIPILQPYLQSSDVDLREAAVSALASINDSLSKEIASKFLDDPEPTVRATALAACKKMKIPSVQNKVVELLDDSNSKVRSAAAGYLKDFPSLSIKTTLDKSMSSEQDKGTRKVLQQAL
jgi:hypothetical protein